MIGRTKTKSATQTAVWLPNDMHAELKVMGEQSGHGMGEEIRKLLEFALMARKNPDDMHQFSVRLPPEIHEKLKAVGGERRMGDQIRTRLEASFAITQSEQSPLQSRINAAITLLGLVRSVHVLEFELKRITEILSENPDLF